MKMILDLDTGIDDAMALAYAAGNENVELTGVTGTYGNVYTKDGVQNVRNLLHMLKRDDVPVYAGCTHAICKDEFCRLEVSARIHGENGVGQVEIAYAQKTEEDMNGVEFLIASIKKHQKELTIVGTGPMTNLAAAIRKEPEILSVMGKIIVMGGALTVPGNVNQYAEANVFQDPVAANLLFESGADITMVGLDVSQRSQLTREDTKQFRTCGTLSGRTYADMIDYYIGQHEHSNGSACYLHDPSAVVCAMHPEYFNMLPMHMSVVTEGEAAGRTIGNSAKLRAVNPNVKVCIGVDSTSLEDELKTVLNKLFAEGKQEVL